MNHAEIKEIISKLDSAIPKKDAEVAFRSFGETAVYANQEGYLRLGIEFLKQAFNETGLNSDIEYLIDKNSDFSIDHFTISKEQFDFISS